MALNPRSLRSDFAPIGMNSSVQMAQVVALQNTTTLLMCTHKQSSNSSQMPKRKFSVKTGG